MQANQRIINSQNAKVLIHVKDLVLKSSIKQHSHWIRWDFKLNKCFRICPQLSSPCQFLMSIPQKCLTIVLTLIFQGFAENCFLRLWKKRWNKKSPFFPSWCLTYCNQIPRLSPLVLSDGKYVTDVLKSIVWKLSEELQLIDGGILDRILSSWDWDKI